MTTLPKVTRHHEEGKKCVGNEKLNQGDRPIPTPSSLVLHHSSSTSLSTFPSLASSPSAFPSAPRSPPGSPSYSDSFHSNISLFDHPFDIQFRPFDTNGGISSPSSRLVFAVAQITGQVQLFAIESPDDLGETLSSLAKSVLSPHKFACRALQFASPDVLLTCSSDCSIAASDLEVGKTLCKVENAHSSPVNKLLSGERCFLSGDDRGTVKLWDIRTMDSCSSLSPSLETDTGRKRKKAKRREESKRKVEVERGLSSALPPLFSLPPSFSLENAHADFISAFEWMEEGRQALCTSGDGSVSVIDLRKKKVLARSDSTEDGFLCVQTVKGGRKTVCGSESGVIWIYSKGEWEDCSDRFPGHPQSIDCMLKVDEDTLLTGSSDGMIRVVSILPNSVLGVWGTHKLKNEAMFSNPDEDTFSSIEAMAFSPDRSLLATTAHDKTVKLWDASSLFECDEEEEADGGGEGESEGLGGDSEETGGVRGGRGDIGEEQCEAAEEEVEEEEATKKRGRKKSKLKGSGADANDVGNGNRLSNFFKDL